MLGRGSTGTGFEETTAIHQRHDGEHLGTGAELKDRKQVGQVVAEHVASDGNSIIASLRTLQRDACCLDWRQDADIEPFSVAIL